MHFLENAWKKHTIKTMFVSKLAYGLSTPLLVTSGLVRLPYVRFVRWALLVTIFQYGLLMTIGYYLGRSYDSAIGYVHYAEIIVAAFAVLFIIGFFAIQKYARRKVEQMEHSDII